MCEKIHKVVSATLYIGIILGFATYCYAGFACSTATDISRDTLFPMETFLWRGFSQSISGNAAAVTATRLQIGRTPFIYNTNQSDKELLCFFSVPTSGTYNCSHRFETELQMPAQKKFRSFL